MKRQINVSETESSIVFTLDGGEPFCLDKVSLTIDSKRLYETFFKGLSEKPEYEVVSQENVSKECSYYVLQFESLIEQTLGKIEDSWFQDAVVDDVLNK